MRAYERAHVLDYVTWRVLDGAIDWRALRENRYELLPRDPQGRYRSVAFPGLWLDPEALLRGDLTTVLEVVRLGVATPEHAVFVTRLRGENPG